jgi:riboflavin kinase/FMN adenylyltransferase
MRVIHDLIPLTPQKDVFLTIGVFDGVHRGHQTLIGQVVQRAREMEGVSALLTLHPHPLKVLAPEMPVRTLTTLEERIALLRETGLDLVIVLAFTPQVARTPARDFVLTLTRHLRIRELWVGPDFALGHQRQGSTAFLQRLGHELGFAVHVVTPFQLDGEIVSSSRLRALLAEGRVAEAARLLGRNPRLRGTVVAGAERGKGLGFPTANLSLDEQQVIPADGVYAVRARLGREIHDGVANIGVRPSFDNGARTVEVHLLDVDRDIYGQELELQFVERLRDEQRFPDADQLVAQVERDTRNARRLLSLLPYSLLPTPLLPRYEEIEHTADLAMRAYGRDLEELFANAAYGLFDLMAEPAADEPPRRREVALEGSDYEALLVDWLNELIYLHEVEGETYHRFTIQDLSPTLLRATVEGGPTGRKTKAIKAATFHDLRIRQTEEGYEATMVFDV